MWSAMTKEKFILILGVIVAVLPNLGFSNDVEKIVAAVIGLLIIVIAYGIHFDKKRNSKKDTVLQDRREVFEKMKEEDGSSDVKVVKKKEELTGFSYVNREKTGNEKTPS